MILITLGTFEKKINVVGIDHLGHLRKKNNVVGIDGRALSDSHNTWDI